LPDTLPAKFRSAIKEFAENLAENLKDEKMEVYLFGSLARGDYLLDSDIDLIVVTDSLKNMKPWERTAYLRKLAPRSLGFDILCYTREEFEKAKPFWENLIKIL
jgi:hypothetical protein